MKVMTRILFFIIIVLAILHICTKYCDFIKTICSLIKLNTCDTRWTFINEFQKAIGTYNYTIAGIPARHPISQKE
jgi:hypothetical protein